MLTATPRPTRRAGPLGGGGSRSASSARRRHSPAATAVSSRSPVGSVSPLARKLRSRTASGSSPSAAATRSICCSYAKVTCIAPKPRNALVGTLLVNTAGAPDLQGEVGLDGHVLLAAEPAAHVGADHPDPAGGQAEDGGDGGGVLDHLRGHAQGDHPGGVDPADAGLRLQVGVLDPLGPVDALDHQVSRL